VKIAFFLLFAAALAGCSSSATLVSHQRPADRQFAPDQTVFLKDQKLTVGVQNDNEFLYLQIGIPDRRRQRQVVFQGLTVWLDYQGGEEKRLGIHYPLPGERPFGGERLAGERPPADQPDTAALTPITLSDDIEIIGPAAGEHHRTTMTETRGITVKLDNSDGVMKYLLTVPLSDNGEHLYGIGTRSGGTIGIGIESGTFMPGGRGGAPMMGGEGGGGMGGGRGGGRGGRGGGGFGRRGGGERPSGDDQGRPEPIKFWAKVQLTGS
jgi:hypothetical protein